MIALLFIYSLKITLWEPEGGSSFYTWSISHSSHPQTLGHWVILAGVTDSQQCTRQSKALEPGGSDLAVCVKSRPGPAAALPQQRLSHPGFFQFQASQVLNCLAAGRTLASLPLPIGIILSVIFSEISSSGFNESAGWSIYVSVASTRRIQSRVGKIKHRLLYCTGIRHLQSPCATLNRQDSDKSHVSRRLAVTGLQWNCDVSHVTAYYVQWTANSSKFIL
jgi:hypothetical protein